jgi:diacylglycerol kinase (ATP)
LELGQSALAPGRHALRKPPKPAAPVLVLVNPRASGLKDPERVFADVLTRLRWAGVRAEGRLTAGVSELREALAGRAARIVLVGGDGSVQAALNAGGALPEVALVPAGRANNIARALGIPRDVGAAVGLAATRPARPIDVLRVTSGSRVLYAVEGVSAGFQAEARAGYASPDSADLLAGARALAGALGRYRPYRVELSVDGRRAFSGDAAQVFISNLPLFGFGFRVDPIARVADGRAEAIVVEAGSRLALARLLASAYRGRHLSREGVHVSGARSALLESPLPLVCDSTVLGAGTAEVTVEQGRLGIVS